MDLLGKMGDEGTRRHRHGIGRIELVARANPPRALEHSDEAVVGVKVRAAEVVARELFVYDDVETGFFRITDQYRAPIPTSALPLDLIRQLVDDRCWIELHGVCCSSSRHHRADHNGYTDRVEIESQFGSHCTFPLLLQRTRACIQLGGVRQGTEQNQTRNTVL
jgi:hypothetical protein